MHRDRWARAFEPKKRRERKYRWEEVTEWVDHPVWGHCERPVTYWGADGRLHIRRRRVRIDQAAAGHA